jgi:hypothetical protein
METATILRGYTDTRVDKGRKELEEMLIKETESITNRINDIERIHLLVEDEIGPECQYESLMAYTREKIPVINEKIANNTVTTE